MLVTGNTTNRFDVKRDERQVCMVSSFPFLVATDWI